VACEPTSDSASPTHSRVKLRFARKPAAQAAAGPDPSGNDMRRLPHQAESPRRPDHRDADTEQPHTELRWHAPRRRQTNRADTVIVRVGTPLSGCNPSMPAAHSHAQSEPQRTSSTSRAYGGVMARPRPARGPAGEKRAAPPNHLVAVGVGYRDGVTAGSAHPDRTSSAFDGPWFTDSLTGRRAEPAMRRQTVR
jgi:hypothetical protein